ncbi:MAG: hypothetical protein JSR59_19025 [Proteobacteria bacterium]|nr:hypothetical protein [Pseudomonadota bacterium]
MNAAPMRKILAALALLLAAALPALAQDAAALHARNQSLEAAFAASPFGRPLVLQSQERDDVLQGDVYARIGAPYADVQKNLQGTAHWCEILILHLNVKGCHASANGLALLVGRKFEQPESDATRLDFGYRAVASSADYLQVRLDAADGPMGTSDYRIVLEAVPLDARTSFLHMSYAYRYGTAARIAMSGYLATLGRGKVGFTVTGQGNDGKPNYIDGIRGVLERNTMRYYLAIDVYLASLAQPSGERNERRLAAWFDVTERYARQLHEMERDDYLAMKRHEVAGATGAASGP